MVDYVEKMVDEFPYKLKKTDTSLMPASENLYGSTGGKKLDKKQAKTYHTWVAKGLFVSKRARMDLHPTSRQLHTRQCHFNIKLTGGEQISKQSHIPKNDDAVTFDIAN